MKKLFCICGSTRMDSSNMQLLHYLERKFSEKFEFNYCNYLGQIPWFDPSATGLPPRQVQLFFEDISNADAVLICTPEYVFSLPGILKNALEWTVSTVLFNEKPCAMITASSMGEKAHESLQLIMKTLGVRTNHTSLLIPGIRTKLKSGEPVEELEKDLQQLMSNLISMA